MLCPEWLLTSGERPTKSQYDVPDNEKSKLTRVYTIHRYSDGPMSYMNEMNGGLGHLCEHIG